ncbi:MAG: putative transciptional Regulator, IclR family [Phenylobacterium sp.]|nr:putative transciptional Regulator, IclR family [Phenylobacterium sp.]
MARATSEPGEEKNLMSALSRGIQVLRCFSSFDQELSSRELLTRTGLPRPTVFRITSTLRQLGLLRYSESRSTFTLGLGLLTMAAPVLTRLTVRQFARPLMQTLADFSEGQVMMTVGEGHDLVVVEVVQGANSTVARLEIGTRLSLARTVTGRAFLLSLPEAERAAFVAETAAADPQRGKTLDARLSETAADLSQNGFALDQSEYVRELASLAAPMRTDIDGQVVVFSCSVPSFVADAQRLREVGQRLASLVRSVEASIGHHGSLSHGGFHEPLANSINR